MPNWLSLRATYVGRTERRSWLTTARSSRHGGDACHSTRGVRAPCPRMRVRPRGGGGRRMRLAETPRTTKAEMRKARHGAGSTSREVGVCETENDVSRTTRKGGGGGVPTRKVLQRRGEGEEKSPWGTFEGAGLR
jgi:hypothetical protein